MVDPGSANSIIMNILHLLILFYLVFTGCNLFNLGGDQEKFEAIFKAEINGELYDISDKPETHVVFKAVVTTQGAYSYLGIFSDIYQQELFPYKESLSFSLIWEENKTEYYSKRDSILIGKYYLPLGGTYYEADGDALISTFNSPTDDDGFITVNIEKLNNDKEVVFGNFEYSVVTRYPLDECSQRVGQDTLHITNGEYRLLLDDRREE